VNLKQQKLQQMKRTFKNILPFLLLFTTVHLFAQEGDKKKERKDMRILKKEIFQKPIQPQAIH
jgi:hypothetical protein